MTKAVSSSKNVRDYVLTIAAILIMLFFGYIPAPSPITPVGMKLLGQLLGLVILWTAVDLVWPTFLGMVLFGTIAFQLYPNSTQTAGLYEAGLHAFGDWIVIFIMCCLIICVALEEAGIIRRIAFWFLTRKFAMRSPWTFTFMFMFAALVIGLFLDCAPAQFVMLAISHEIFEALGFKKGDHWPRIIVIGVSYSIIIAFCMTPICHTLTILYMGILGAISGQAVNMFSYMLVGIPVGAVIWILMYLWFRFIVKPDVSVIEKADLSVIEKMKPGPMGRREKWIAAICILIVFFWIFPGILSIAAPQSALFLFLDSLTGSAPLMLAIVVMAIVKIDGRPLLNVREALSKLDWTPVVLLACVMMVAGAISEEPTGVGAWIDANLVPLLSGLTPFALVALICVIACLATNFFTNVAVGIAFISFGVPIALSMGINPIVVGMAVCIASNLAFAIPPSFVPVGVAFADPWGTGGTCVRNGLMVMVIGAVVSAVLVYPLSALVFGA